MSASTSTGKLPSNYLLQEHYRVLDQLGAGGMGAVYRAADVRLGNRLVAIKEMSQSGLNSQQEIDQAAEAFKRETLMLASLRHPNLPRIYDHFFDSGRWYLVMDFIEGETLDDYLYGTKGGHLLVEEVLHIAIQLSGVLGYLHTHTPPIVFRDLKPSNVMQTTEQHLYLIDFGIARHFKAGKAKDTQPFVSPGYAAPEQYGQAQTTPRSDIYSLGALLHHLLSGHDPSETPFRFPPLRDFNTSVPNELDALITQMLELDQSKRPANATVIRQKLEQIRTSHTQGQPPTAPVPPRASPPIFEQGLQRLSKAAQNATQKLAGWLSSGDSSLPPSNPILPDIARSGTPRNNFFISYNKADQAWAEWIAWQLEDAGYSAILPDWDFRPGSHFEVEMQKAAGIAECTIVVLSPHYLNARDTQSAWTTALKRGTLDEGGILLPVCVCECEPKLKKLLGSIIYIDLIGLDESVAREKLLAGVRNERWKPTTTPVFPGKWVSHSSVEQPPFPVHSGHPKPVDTQLFATTAQKSNLPSTYTLLPLENVEVFFSYSHVDTALRAELEKYLSNLKRQRSITGWHDGEIGPGNEWADEIDTHLSQANIILLLVSQDFIASDYCFDIEMKKALERHERGEACVIPIILRPAHWKETPFGRLQALPRGGTPITMWPNRDEAFLDVAQGIQRVVNKLTRRN